MEREPLDANGEPPSLGGRLRSARKARGTGLRELAKQVGVSPSLISQVERDKVTPSVATLYAIVHELGLSMDDLFSAGRAADGGEEPYVQLRETRQTMFLAFGVRWERLTPKPDAKLDFQIAVYDVGAESCPADAPITHAGTEYGIVIEGLLGVTIGDRSYELRPGDSVAFPSMTPHRLWNLADAPATVVWVVVGRESDRRVNR